MNESQLMYVDLGLLALACLCFVNMLYYQLKFILKVARPLHAEDDLRIGPLRVIGEAKVQRLRDFFAEADPVGLRGKLSRAWLYVLCSFVALFSWAGVVRALVVV